MTVDDKFFEILFQNTRNQYRDFRKYERDKIKRYLDKFKKNKSGFTVIETKAFTGRFKYNNWFGVDVVFEYNGKQKAVFISLQTFDNNEQKCCVDKQSKQFIDYTNYYIIMDSIGIYEYPQYVVDNHINNGEKLHTIDAYKDMDTTDIYLPLNNSKLKKLVDKIKDYK